MDSTSTIAPSALGASPIPEFFSRPGDPFCTHNLILPGPTGFSASFEKNRTRSGIVPNTVGDLQDQTMMRLDNTGLAF